MPSVAVSVASDGRRCAHRKWNNVDTVMAKNNRAVATKTMDRVKVNNCNHMNSVGKPVCTMRANS